MEGRKGSCGGFCEAFGDNEILLIPRGHGGEATVSAMGRDEGSCVNYLNCKRESRVIICDRNPSR